MPSKDADPNKLMVADDRAMHRACRRLRDAGSFGFDTEFIRERSYLPQLCLVQAATGGGVFIIDPLRVDVGEFWRLVVDAKLQKVVHAGSQDFELCHQHTGRAPANIFDVQVAAGLVGEGYPLSYEKLARAVLGVKLARSQAYSEWARRPLTTAQLRYAAADVAHLSALRDELGRRLTKLRRQGWMAEEMTAFEDAGLYACDTDQLWRRVRGHKGLRSRELAVLHRLAPIREAAARKDDTPPRSLLRDPVLTTIARRMPTTIGELRDTRGFPRPLARQIGHDIIEAVKEARALGLSELPSAIAPLQDDPADKMLTDLASAAGQALCTSNGVNHGLFATRDDYAQLVRAVGGARRRRSADGTPRLLTGWRKDFAGRMLKDMLTGRRTIRVTRAGGQPDLDIE